jgi:hypothetical protein
VVHDNQALGAVECVALVRDEEGQGARVTRAGIVVEQLDCDKGGGGRCRRELGWERDDGGDEAEEGDDGGEHVDCREKWVVGCVECFWS